MFLFRILFILLFIYGIFVLLLFCLQRRLMYEPDISNTSTHLTHDVDSVIVESNGISLNGWYFLQDKNYKTLLFFHGNAGSLDKRIPKLNQLSRFALNYLIVAYRGFHGNDGTPTEKGLYQDAAACKEWLNTEKNIPDCNIILYGESLGCAIALELATQYKFAGVILEAPFTSMSDMIYKRYPFLPPNFSVHDKYDNREKIKQLDSPLLILHGNNDTVVPVSMGKELLETATTPEKKGYFTKDEHTIQIDKQVQQVMKKFFQEIN